MSRTDQSVFSELQRLVLEPATGGVTWQSTLWSTAELHRTFNDEQASLARLFGSGLQMVTVPTVGATTNRYDLPNECLAALYADWEGADGSWTALTLTDAWDLDHGLADWEIQPATRPVYYTLHDLPQRQIEVAPAAADAGRLWVTYVPTPALAATPGPVTLTLGEDDVEIVKWATYGQMLGKIGRSADLRRSAHARWLAAALRVGVLGLWETWE